MKSKSKKPKKEKKILESPKVRTPHLDAIKAIKRGIPNDIVLVRGPNPRIINGFFTDEFIMEQRAIKNWLHQDE